MKRAHTFLNWSTGLVLAVACAGLLWSAVPDEAWAFPHETRIVGPYRLVVGFRAEPAFEDQNNSIDIFVYRASDGRPINAGAGDVVDLTVDAHLRDHEAYVSNTIQTAPLDKPAQAFGTANQYGSWFKPTVNGTYAFHFTGTVSDSTNPVAGPQFIDETFVCGHGTLAANGHGFHCVDDPQIFPVSKKDQPTDKTGYEDSSLKEFE